MHPSSLNASCEARSGFTLMELLIASALGLIVLTAFVMGFSQHRQVYREKNLEQELQFNVRSAMSFLVEDLTNAGNGLVMGVGQAPNWFGKLSGATQVPYIIDGGSGPDRIITAGISGSPVATLSQRADAGDLSVSIQPTTGNPYLYSPQVGDVLLVGGVEAVLVTRVVTALGISVLIIKTDPYDATAGLELDYPSGADVYLLNEVEYAIQDLNGSPALIREDSRFNYSSNQDKRIAEGIVDLQASRTDDHITLSLTGRTRAPSVVGSDEADGYPRYTLNTDVELRVPDPQLRIGHWPSYALVATPTPTASP